MMNIRSALLVSLLCLVLFGGSSEAAITCANSAKASADASSTTIVLAFTSNVTAGSLLVAAVYAGVQSRTFSATDTLGNTWQTATTVNQTTDGHEIGLLYAMNSAGGANTVTVTISGASSPSRAISVVECTGIATSSALDKISTSTGNVSTALSSGTTVTTTVANEVLIGWFGGSGLGNSATPGSGYTALQTVLSDAAGLMGYLEYQIVSSTGAYSATATAGANQDYSGLIATFKQAASSISTEFMGLRRHQ